MNKKLQVFLVLLTIILLGFCFSMYTAKVNAAGVKKLDDTQQIKQVINQYFEARYHSFKSLKRDNFNSLT